MFRKCRSCKSKNQFKFIDLKKSPVSNAYIEKKNLNKKEKIYPLRTFVCKNCKLVQTEDYVKSKSIFNKDYIYLSSFIKTLVDDSNFLVKKMIKEFNICKKDKILEIAANDGYLLQFFKKRKVNCLGVDPSHKAVKIARKKGIKMIEDFFSYSLSKKIKLKYGKFNYLIAKNVLAHVPNLDDFVHGVANILDEKGVACFEFQYLNELIKKSAFDQIYHEHFSYISLTAAINIFKRHNLLIFNCEETNAQNGSLRIFVKQKKNYSINISENVRKILSKENKENFLTKKNIRLFQNKINNIRKNFKNFLNINKSKKIAAYGAAAKGNTLLNFAGINYKNIDFVVDLNTEKQGKYLPGSKIPIVGMKKLIKNIPDFIIILPWNLVDEITKQLYFLKKEKTKFVQVFPKLKILR